VGLVDGSWDGPRVGARLGIMVGVMEGERLGAVVGSVLGACEGVADGARVGTSLGPPVGAVLGVVEGSTVGASEGSNVGAVVGRLEGHCQGRSAGQVSLAFDRCRQMPEDSPEGTRVYLRRGQRWWDRGRPGWARARKKSRSQRWPLGWDLRRRLGGDLAWCARWEERGSSGGHLAWSHRRVSARRAAGANVVDGSKAHIPFCMRAQDDRRMIEAFLTGWVLVWAPGRVAEWEASMVSGWGSPWEPGLDCPLGPTMEDERAGSWAPVATKSQRVREHGRRECVSLSLGSPCWVPRMESSLGPWWVPPTAQAMGTGLASLRGPTSAGRLAPPRGAGWVPRWE
jgi:hypothetical protein